MTEQDGEDVYAMLQSIGAEENAFKNEAHGMTFPEYRRWLEKQAAWAGGAQLPDGYVRQWTYWQYVGDVPVGYGKLREKVTAASREQGGNVGFAIDPRHRGKGYGTLLFQFLLEQGRAFHLPELFSTVEKYNYPSKRVHEKLGGALVRETDVRWFFSFPV